jgi:hypothetical protein
MGIYHQLSHAAFELMKAVLKPDSSGTLSASYGDKSSLQLLSISDEL